jgi:Zn-dependent peptidase ImmA (M78 family)/transcriptional regulator with XRE-family HTH domain
MAKAEQINPRMLSWARETAGLSAEEAAQKLGLKDTAKATAADKLRAIEHGRRGISQGMLQKAVASYHRPLIAFYLPEPPTREDRGEDFRIAGTVSPRDNGMLEALLRDIRARQQMVREVLADEEDAKTLPFVASAKVELGAVAVAAAVRATLGITEMEQKQAKGPEGLFVFLRAAAERIGIFVLLLGDLGSHHSDISEDLFRGFALADNIAPFVVINDNDAPAARAFTLLHEMAHIWIGASGVSGPLRDLSGGAIELFCNDVAGAFLLPPGALPDLTHLRGEDIQAVNRETQRISAEWNVSQPAVTYRLARNGWIAPDVAASLFTIFARRWRQDKQRTKDTREPDEGGPNYYILRRHRLGAALLNVVRRALQADALTQTRAAKILGVNPMAVGPLLQEQRRAAPVTAPQ